MGEVLLDIPAEEKHWVLRRRRILGKGSFGCATLYEEVGNPDNLVVVKDVNLQTMKKDEEMKALEMEVAILRQSMGHPNIVQFIDYYHDGDFMVYIVMEYCAKGDIGQIIEQMCYNSAPESENFIASTMIQILVGLHFLHVDQRTLHRDIKPQNIFLCEDGVVRIGDFGVSTVLEQFGSLAKAACGSPYYMAPEVCEERAYDGKADLWSLGVSLYELMVLEKPFAATSMPTLMRLITKGQYNPIPSTLPYTKELVDLVQSFLQTSVTARPTLRRALRSSYVQRSLSYLPLRCLESPYYRQLFGEDAVENALRLRKKQENSNFPAAAVSSTANDLTELEMWLEKNGSHGDSLSGVRAKQKVSKSLHEETSIGTRAVGNTPIKPYTDENKKCESTVENDKNSEDAYEDDFESESSCSH